MAFIQTIPDDEADGEVAELYEADRQEQGYVANYTRVFAHRPHVLQAWVGLGGSIREGMDLRRYELATFAAARRVQSSYCSLAHGKVLTEQFFTPDEVHDMAKDHHAAGLDDIDIAVMDLADKVVADATSVTEADFARLRDLGCTDAEILDVIMVAAARCFFSKVLDAAGARPDSAFYALDPALREVLTVGRPIADP